MRYSAIILLFISSVAFGQNNQKCNWVSSFDTPLQLDSLSLVPGSFTISSPARIQYDLSSNLLTLTPRQNTDSIKLCYTTFPFRLNAVHQNRTASSNFETEETKETLEAEKTQSSLIKSGLISRGASVGNTRDMALNSRMDFRLQGDITDNLKIEATLFDQNIPYQPEGNTNSLKNFDRVHINLFNENFSLEAGDIYLNQNSPTLTKYSRGIMGAGITLRDSSHLLTFKTGVNKGRFHSFQFMGTDGVNGPYRINGPVDDPYVIVLAGSEKVYLDGQKLNRGLEGDYEIDYNLGEITFSHKHIISRYSRIRVDFEFMNRSFQRSSRVFEYSKGGEKSGFYLSYYNEKDNPAISSGITEEEIERMREFSNEPVLDIQVIEFDPTRVSYILKQDEQFGQILEESSDPTEVHHLANFRYVGEGMGNYQRRYDQNNQLIYSWVEPIDGVKQGNYSPFKELRTPTRLDLLSAGVYHSINPFESARTELAFSSMNANLLGSQQGETGLALKSGLNSVGRPLGKTGLSTRYGVNYEFLGKGFTQADPIRNVDFEREWGVANSLDQNSNDHYISVFGGLLRENKEVVSVEANWRNKGDWVDGKSYRIHVSEQRKHLHVRAMRFQMNNEARLLNSQWNENLLEFRYPAKRLQPGYKYWSQKNMTFHEDGTSLLSSLQNFEEHRLFLQSAEDQVWRVSSYFSIREDLAPVNGQFLREAKSSTLSTSVKRTGDLNSLEAGITHRNMEDGLTTQKITMGNVTGNLTLLNGWVKTFFRGETGSGWEPRREYVYVEVPLGQGHYAWRDLNDNGIQELGEFFEAIHEDEKNYAKFFVSSHERIAAFDTKLDADVKIKMPGTESVLARKFYARVSVSTTAKTIENSERFESVLRSLDYGATVSGRRRLVAQIHAKELGDFASISIGTRNYDSKSWVLNGFELSQMQQYNLNASFIISSAWVVNLSSRQTQKNINSDVLAGRDYNFTRFENRSNLVWTPSPNWTMNMSYGYKTSKGFTSDILVNSNLHVSAFSSQLRLLKSSILRTEIEWASVLYDGNPNTAMGYDLMEAYLPGNNWRSIISLQQELKSGLMLNLMYIGRKTPGANLIHRANLQVSARF